MVPDFPIDFAERLVLRWFSTKGGTQPNRIGLWDEVFLEFLTYWLDRSRARTRRRGTTTTSGAAGAAAAAAGGVGRGSCRRRCSGCGGGRRRDAAAQSSKRIRLDNPTKTPEEAPSHPHCFQSVSMGTQLTSFVCNPDGMTSNQ